MEIMPEDEPKPEKEATIESPREEEKFKESGSSATLIKLIMLVLLAFLVVKYGVPLMNQISEKSTEVLAKEDTDKPDAHDTSANEPEPIAKATTSDVRITEGFATWEPAVREQIEYWISEGVSYKLLSIDVNDAKDTMEIRYRIQNKEGFGSREKIVLKKDGFGDRFIFTEGDKEFLVRPPE